MSQMVFASIQWVCKHNTCARARVCVKFVDTFRFRLKFHNSRSSDVETYIIFMLSHTNRIARTADIIFIAVYKAAPIHSNIYLFIYFLIRSYSDLFLPAHCMCKR